MESSEIKEKHVYFVRHGEAENNIGEKIERGPEALLTEKGRQQAEVVAKRVEKLQVEALVSSTFTRAFETASAISRVIGRNVEKSDLFTEWRHASELQNKSQNDPVQQAIIRIIHEAEDHFFRYSDEETFAEFADRGTTALEHLRTHPAGRICVITHGGFLRLLLGLVQFPGTLTRKQYVSLFWHVSTTNTGVTYLRHEPKHGWRLITWNDSAHLG